MPRVCVVALWLTGLELTACGGEGTNPTASGPPAAVFVQGDSGTGPVGTSIPVPLVILANGAQSPIPVADWPVTFTVTAGGGAITPATARSNHQGNVLGAMWTLGPTAGIQTASVGISGYGGPAPVLHALAYVTSPPGVTIGENGTTFVPDSVEISVGTLFAFTWSGPANHNVMMVNPPFFYCPLDATDPGCTAPPPWPGVYRYYCSIHGAVVNGQPTGMAGVVVVK
jgi:plastocyanin